MNQLSILKQPVISEKSFVLADRDKYVFIVQKEANKIEITKAIETAFKVHVIKVNTFLIKGKVKRFGRITGKRSDYKKAIVSIKKGEKIEEFKGI
jgi:large subunit ribosomal protein L23